MLLIIFIITSWSKIFCKFIIVVRFCTVDYFPIFSIRKKIHRCVAKRNELSHHPDTTKRYSCCYLYYIKHLLLWPLNMTKLFPLFKFLVFEHYLHTLIMLFDVIIHHNSLVILCPAGRRTSNWNNAVTSHNNVDRFFRSFCWRQNATKVNPS